MKSHISSGLEAATPLVLAQTIVNVRSWPKAAIGPIGIAFLGKSPQPVVALKPLTSLY